MRIAIDGRYVNDHFPGIGRYVYNLALALAESGAAHTFALLHNPELPNIRFDMAALARYPSIRIIPTHIRLFSPGEQVHIPRLLRAIHADLYHAPYYVRPYAGLACRSITTLYDAIPRLFPAEVSRRARWLFDVLTRLAIRASDGIVAISASARRDLAAAYGVPAERITVTPLAADPRMRPQPHGTMAAVRAKYGLPERYIFSLSSNKPHKNLVSLVEAFADVRIRGQGSGASEARSGSWHPASDPTLVIAGHWDPRYPEAREVAQRLGLGERVRWLPDVAEADLPALYSGAEVFAFPSRYEGFGLPPLEALACGAPVLCCDTSSMPEVVGGAALRVAPTPGALAAGLAQLLGDADLRAKYRAAGSRQAARFSWQTTAHATLAVYEQVAAPR